MTESDATDRSPLVELSTTAIERLRSLIETVPGPAVAGIRLQILRRGPEGFEHQLTIVDAGHEPEDDDELDADGIRFFIEDRNAAPERRSARGTCRSGRGPAPRAPGPARPPGG